MNRTTIVIASSLLIFGMSPSAWATPQQETNKTINVVGINAGFGFAFVAVNNPGPSAPPTCGLSLLTMPLDTAGLQQYETARNAKIAGKAVTIFFDDTDCVVDQLQLQLD